MDSLLRDRQIGVVGAGRMAGAIMRGLLRSAAVRPAQILASRRDVAALEAMGTELGIRTTADNRQVAAETDMLLLGVKPQDLGLVLEELRAPLRADLVISLAAGIPTASIEAVLGSVPVVRAMPNTPALVGAGVAGYCGGRHARAPHLALAREVLQAVGRAFEVPEAKIDALTAVSGSGPAYFFLLAEHLAAAGRALGLEPGLAAELAAGTLAGSGRLIEARGADPAALRAQVTSPGGTTEAALEAFGEGGLERLVAEAASACVRRAAELAEGR